MPTQFTIDVNAESPLAALFVRVSSTSGFSSTLCLMQMRIKLTTQKSQNATRPADPEEVPSKPMPKPTPEHPVGHPNVPTQKDTAKNSADPQCFLIFQHCFLF